MNIGRTILSALMILAMLVAGCDRHQAPRPEIVNPNDTELAELVDWMCGSFSSEAQASADSSYYHIRLDMTRIWPSNSDGAWLYIEQAVAGHDPYRQRVYHVTRASETEFASAVYELPDPKSLIGAWQSPASFNNLSPSQLTEREGCVLLLHREGNRYIGSTNERECKSSLRGATYATSEVDIRPTGMLSWDRGYNDAGEQVWGAVKAGYKFDKLQ